MHYKEGDRCFLLGLFGCIHGSLDLLTGHWMVKSGTSSCSLFLRSESGNINSILRSTPKDVKGLFMVEGQVQKKKLSASAKLAKLRFEMAEEGFEEVTAQE